ncbi:MAG: hypothetical protein LQ343_005364 [Gyalolechia ehrenbergii]|nr:MAG: hypothetical protein LQ343_005364 [Gyalolechia ehrenbergii]
MSENNIDLARAAKRLRNAKTLPFGPRSPDPKLWSIQKVYTVAGKVSQRLAEYDLWIQGQAKKEVEKMARERDVSITTVKKDIRTSGQMVDAILKYLECSNLWTIVILLLVYIPKPKLDDIESKILPDLVPQPKIYHGHDDIYESRDVLKILTTAYYTLPARQKPIHRRKMVIESPEGGSIHQLILPLLTQCQPSKKSKEDQNNRRKWIKDLN